MTTIGKIDVFDETQESWETYVEQVQHFFAANDVDDNHQVPTLLNVQREIKELLNGVATKSPQKNTIEDSSDSGNEVLSVPEQSSEQSTIQEVQIEASGSTSLSPTNDAPQPAPTE
ncbi:Hypothetical predicted protein, partial [Paramuricea clavata]